MTVREEHGALIVQHDSTRLATAFLVLAAVCFIALLCSAAVAGARGAPGLAVAGFTSGLIGALLYETSQFTFDSRSQLVTWRRRWAWSRQAGTLPFAGVKDVIVRSPVGDEGTPSRQLCLHLVEGRDLPLTRGSATDGDNERLNLAGRIRTFIHPQESAETSATVAALVRRGEKMQAIRLLRDTESLSLEEAVRRVEEID